MFAFLPLAWAIVSCGGSGSSGTINVADIQPHAANLVTEQQKIDFLSACGAKMDSWKALPRATRHANLVAWARTQPVIALSAVLAATDEPYFQYKDGDASVYADAGSVLPKLLVKPPIRTPKYDDQPGNIKAGCIFGFDSTTPDNTFTIKSYLEAQGYSATRLVNPTVSSILTLNGVGVLFAQGHGGMFVDKVNGISASHMALDFGEKATVATGNGAYARYRLAHEVVIVGREHTDINGKVTVISEYGITDKFIRNRMKFSDNSLICMDACDSGNPVLANAFLASNAGSYVGWSAPSQGLSGHSFEKLFDRMLGENAATPVSTIPERSFDLDATKSWMQKKGYDRDETPGSAAKLVWYNRPNYKSLILRPTIARVLWEGWDNSYKKARWLLEGTFGPDPGPTLRTITWGQTPCEVLSWDTNGIRIKMPTPTPQGDIQITKETRKSNPVPLTAWTVPLTYTLYGKGSLKLTIKMNARFRADIKGLRLFPQDPVSYYPVVFYTLEDSVGSLSASGNYKPDPNTTITWSGTEQLRGFNSSDFPVNGMLFSGYFDFSRKVANGEMLLNSTFTRTVTTSSGSSSTKLQATADGFLQLRLPFDTASFGIGSGSAAAQYPLGTPDAVSAQTTWGASSPTDPPTDHTKR